MKKNIYSIRKSKFGAVSTKIAAVTFLMLAGGVAVSELNTTAYAAETTQNKNEERKIESPVEYTADSAKEVGYKEVKVQGNDGKFTLKNNGNESIAERVEPTKTEVVLGTKPKVEKEIEKAKIEYKVDDTKEYGIREVVKEAKDGEKTTTTTYKIVTKPKVKLSEKIEKMLNSDNYMYTDEKFYSIDNSKELPSDKIVIDKLFVSIPEKQNIGEKTGVRELIQTGIHLVEEGKLKDKYITPEMMDPKNPDIREIKRNYYTFDDNKTEEDYGVKEYDYSKDKDFYSILLKEGSDGLIMLSGGHYLTNEVLRELNEDKLVERYFAKYIITESMYADAKANYQRLQLAKEKLGDLTESQKELVENAERAFNSITQHYNNINGYRDKLNITYEGNIPDSVKEEFEKQLLKLPYEIRKNLVQLRVTTNELKQTEHAKNNNRSLIGLAYYYLKNIVQKYEESREIGVPTDKGKKEELRKLKQPEALLDNLMHEISHIIDATGGLGSSFFAFDGIKGAGIVTSQESPFSFSSSKEFDDVYNKYFKNEINYKNYYRTSKEEAFADSLGEYINKRIYGVPYTRYKTIEGVEYEFKDVNDPNYATATTPVDKAEYYFANLYNKLFEQPTEAKVVVDTIKETNSAVQDGLIVLGTKTKEERVEIPYTTEIKEDNTLEKGLRKVVQAGVNGEILKITSYALANKETGKLSSTTTEKLVKEMIKEVVLLGTKEVEQPKEEVKPDETKQEQPKEEVKPEESKEEQLKEEVKPEESKEVEQPKEEVKPEEPKEVEQPKEEVKPEEPKEVEQPKEEVKPEETKEEQPKEAVQTEQPKEVEKIKDTSNKKQEKTVKSAKIAKIQKHKLYVGSKKLPNTGETSNSAMLIGLVSLAVAARLKQSKSK
ncbi:G5 domain-containing protein [Gemella sanguinis]|uniref:G5 domain-containing protein n=1 Tax=Gemella sanguinis TaxID=84135 RepID=UPI00352F33D0